MAGRAKPKSRLLIAKQWVTTSGRLNIVSSVLTLALCIGLGRHLVLTMGTSPVAMGIGQSLLAAAAVTFVATLAAIAQHIFVTRRYETIMSLGIRRFRRRGSPGSAWPKQLDDVKSKLVFFGKDHNKLLAAHADRIKRLLIDRDVAVSFYLLAHTDPYYKKIGSDELQERIEAAEALFLLREQVATSSADAARRLQLFEYDDAPTFSCSLLDQTIIFGPYVHGLKNPDTPEFEIEPTDETWLYDACKAAFEVVVAHDKVRPLNRPPTKSPATAATSAAAGSAAQSSAIL